jgi:hypothetical protein
MNLRLIFPYILVVMSLEVAAYEDWSLPNLPVPTTVKPFGLEIQLQHQFLGRMDGNENLNRFYGIGDGADPNIMLKATVWSTAQVYAIYDYIQVLNRSHNEIALGTSYSQPIPFLFLRCKAEAEYYSYASYLVFPEQRKNNFFVLGSLQNDPLWNRIVGIADVGYGFEQKALGLGFGLDVKVVESFDVFGEYFPVIDRSYYASSVTNSVQNPFAVGVRFTTYGHQFMLYVSNASETGARRLMFGAPDNGPKFGFEIKRLFSFQYPWF